MRTSLPKAVRITLSFAIALTMAGLTPAQAMQLADVSPKTAKKLVNEAGLKPIKKAKKVAVAGYRVAFIVKNVATANGEDYLGGGSGAKSEMIATLDNIDFATMQAITDKAYQNFMTKLAETGIDIVPLETLKANANYQGLDFTPSTAEKPYIKKNGWMDVVVASPKDLPLWFSLGDQAGDKGVFNSKNNKLLAKASKELDAVVIFPTFYIDFAGLSSSGHSKFAKTAETSAGALLRVLGQNSGLMMIDTGFGGLAKFNEGVRLDEAAGPWVEDSKSSNSHWVKTFATMGLDAGPVKGKKEISMNADPAKYAELCGRVLDGAADGLKFAIQDVHK